MWKGAFFCLYLICVFGVSFGNPIYMQMDKNEWEALVQPTDSFDEDKLPPSLVIKISEQAKQNDLSFQESFLIMRILAKAKLNERLGTTAYSQVAICADLNAAPRVSGRPEHSTDLYNAVKTLRVACEVSNYGVLIQYVSIALSIVGLLIFAFIYYRRRETRNYTEKI